ncbi:hypothetical protein ACOSP7_012259 [Xanthoceras sorbifolium]
MSSSGSHRNDFPVHSSGGFLSDLSSTGNLASMTPRVNMASTSPLVSIIEEHGVSSSSVKTMSDNRSPNERDTSIGVSPSVFIKEVSKESPSLMANSEVDGRIPNDGERGVDAI